MGVIGIVANPNSGKDIRRLVTHATVIDNQEKINIVRRVVMAALSMGGHDIYLMPDRFELGNRAIDGIIKEPLVKEHVQLLGNHFLDNQNDTSRFVKKMIEEKQCDVFIVMGGDGTNRAAAKSIGDVPLIPISTGTNNVYPQMIEGTAAGLAAAAIASKIISREECGPRGKLIEITVKGEAGEKTDIALIDAVFSRRTYAGARAIWETDDISSVFVTQCHPATIGFSALAGCTRIIKEEDEFGLYVDLDWEKKEYVAAMSAGMLTEFGVNEAKKIAVGEPVVMVMEHNGIIAVDGEREVTFKEGDTVTLTITLNGPRKVDVKQTVEKAALKGFFKIK